MPPNITDSIRNIQTVNSVTVLLRPVRFLPHLWVLRSFISIARSAVARVFHRALLGGYLLVQTK